MREVGDYRAERLEDFDLHRRIGHVILAADDMRDVKVRVVNNGRQRVEKPAVFADENRIGKRRRIDFDVAAHEIAPGDFTVAQLKAPMRRAPLRLHAAAFVG